MPARAALSGLLILICFIPFAPVGETPIVPSQFYCIGDEKAPLEISLPASSGDIFPGATSSFPGFVRADAEGYLTLRFEGEGQARVLSSETVDLGYVNFGETVPFTVDAGFADNGRAAVHVTAEMRDVNGAVRFAERQSVYAVMSDGRTWIGNGGFIVLEYQAIDDRESQGVITSEEAADLRRALSSPSYIEHQTPLQAAPPTLQQQALNELVGAPPQGYRDISQAPSANITIHGNVQWQDENGVSHPMYGATVSIRDDDGLLGTEYITAVVTDVNGDYWASVDDDDGFGQGDRDIFVVVRAANGWIDTQTLGGDTYVMVGPTHDETPGGTDIVENFTAPNNSGGESFSVFQAGTWHAAYVVNVRGSALSSVDIVWPNGDTGSFFDGKVKMEEEDRWDWDTVGHEYGHFVQSQLNTANNPGGAHSSSDCATDVRPSKGEGLRLSWGESWPTFFAISGQVELNMGSLSVPRVGDDSYQDVEDGSVVYSLETIDGLVGEGTERARMHLLYDLWDNVNDNRDAVSLGHADIWNVIDGGDPYYPHEMWNDLRSGRSTSVDLLMGGLATDEGLGSTLQTPADGAIISPANNSLSWTRGVGCSTVNDGNAFDLIFYDANTLAKLLTVSSLTSPSHNLTNSEISTIVATTHDVLWAVESWNTDMPPSGPYLSENFAATVNRPPVADAGPDQVVECDCCPTTAVLDGTGSYDPDGDILTYSWSGATFDDPTSPTPTGEFAKGSTLVTLEVSDGIQSDTDVVEITVVDTTPPVLTCAVDDTVECASHMGTHKDHPDLEPFFNSVSATDACDPDPVITNDAPEYFELGETVVTFTATDEDGNESTCQAVVTVVDTTPPEITASLVRDVLWPPNHKMALIEPSVEVYDICCPNPEFVLTTITSDESNNDNGVGDGNTDEDIDAMFDTPDTTFYLRSERQGRGDGRVYTIIYTATDCSENTASDTVYVTVPHSDPGQGFLVSSDPGLAPLSLPVVSLYVQGSVGHEFNADKFLLGNIHGAVAPRQVTRMPFVEGEGQGMVVDFNAEDLREVLARSNKKDVLGLSYRSLGEDVSYFLIKDISLLNRLTLTGDSLEEEEETPDIAVQPEVDQPVVSPARLGTVEIYSVTGRRVRVIPDVNLDQLDTFRWDGRTDDGGLAANGVYFYRIANDRTFQPRKMIIVR